MITSKRSIIQTAENGENLAVTAITAALDSLYLTYPERYGALLASVEQLCNRSPKANRHFRDWANVFRERANAEARANG